jgi:hypothetical protein
VKSYRQQGERINPIFLNFWLKIPTIDRLFRKGTHWMDRTFQAIISGTKNTATTGNSMQLLQLPAPLGNSKKKSSKKEQQCYPDCDRTKERY